MTESVNLSLIITATVLTKSKKWSPRAPKKVRDKSWWTNGYNDWDKKGSYCKNTD